MSLHPTITVTPHSSSDSIPMNFSSSSPILPSSTLTPAARGLLALPTGFEVRHPGGESVQTFLAGSAAALGRSDFSQPLKIFRDHWVETVSDLRLLVQEGLLRELGLPIRLCAWIEEEVTALQSSSASPFSPVVTNGSAYPITNHQNYNSSPNPLIPSARVFHYVSDFDTNGVIYYLGTKNPTGVWCNPVSTGQVIVTSSGLMGNSEPLSAVVGREVVRCVTAADEHAWICISLTDSYVYPAAYSLRHYSSWDTECARDWRFEASINKKDWIVLVEHKNDTSLSGKGSTHTWQINYNDPFLSPLTPLQHYFCHFRIYITGPNSNNHMYLCCSGFELYGSFLTGDAYREISEMISPTTGQMTSNGVRQNHSTPTGDVEMKISPSPSILPNPFPTPSTSDFLPPLPPLVDTARHGVIYAVATRNNTSAWVNPVDAGRVIITASSLMEDSAPLSSLLAFDLVRCVTKPVANSWICIDLIDKRLICIAYTLRHYSSWDTEALRSWRLEASNDSIEWIAIKEHKNDESLMLKGQSFTWYIDRGNNWMHAYRYFRILQTGENSNKHHYLACSGWELYGRVLRDDEVTPYWPLERIINAGPTTTVVSTTNGEYVDTTCPYTSDFDRNGIIYYLATQDNTIQFVNPHKSGVISVTASSLADDSEPVDAVVGREVVRCVTKPEERSWMAIDFGPYTCVSPTAYTLRHYSSWDTEALRNWRLEASNDGVNWILLREHRQDDSLALKGASHTWNVESKGQFYRQFRIFQFDENSNRHHYLACSGWEMYGILRRVTSRINGYIPNNISVPATTSQKVPSSDSVDSGSSPMDGVLYTGPDPSITLTGLLRNTNSLPPQMKPSPPLPPALSPALVSDLSLLQTPPLHFSTHTQSLPLPTVSSPTLYYWDAENKGPLLVVSSSTPSLVTNTATTDKWQMIRSLTSFHINCKISVRIVSDPPTSNTWRFILGVIPATLDCKGAKQWVGTAGSWGYIAGTGGKCHGVATTIPYGAKYGNGDIITIGLDFDKSQLEFWKNEESQGVAFDDLRGPVHIAASLTAHNSSIALVPHIDKNGIGDRSMAAINALNVANQAAAFLTVTVPPVPATVSMNTTPTITPTSTTTAPTPTVAHLSNHLMPSPFMRATSLPAIPSSIASTLSSSSSSSTLSSLPLHPPPPPAAAVYPFPPPLSGNVWDPAHKSVFLFVDRNLVRNTGSQDKWQSVRALYPFTRPSGSALTSAKLSRFTIEIVDNPKTPNSWQLIVGVVPPTFICSGTKQWVGAGGSWGYIGGTGGKCFDAPKSTIYGEPWGQAGDRVTAVIDWEKNQLSFIKNGVQQGLAFDNLGGQDNLFAAVSLTAAGATIILVPEG